MFPSRRHDTLEKLIQSQLASDLKRQPRPTELAAVFNANARRINLDPLWFSGRFVDLPIEQRQLIVARSCRCFRVGRIRVARCLLDSQPSRFVKLTQPRDNALSRPRIGAKRFDERPIRMPLAVLVAETLSKKHARKCYRQNHSGPEQKSSLHYVSACSRQVSSGSPPRQNNLRRKTAQNISEKIFLGRYWGSWDSSFFKGFVGALREYGFAMGMLVR